MPHTFRLPGRLLIALTVAMSFAVPVMAQSKTSPRPDFPPHSQVLAGYDKVVTQQDITPMYTLYLRKKDGQLYGELPASFSSKKYFIALTLTSGSRYAGLQSGETYVYWRRFGKRLALIQPNVAVRADGDAHAKSSVDRLFTDRILLEVPIVTMGPKGGPVIDMDQLLVNYVSKFFGGAAFYMDLAFNPNTMYVRNGILSAKKVKAFKSNCEIAFEVPATDGTLKTIHYSISEIPSSTGYRPRIADERVGYFITDYTDLSKYDDEDKTIRYINRWKLEKADPKLRISPPKEPIVFYIEHTTPVRYRRWVRDGVLCWNKAFERVGISDAIEVHYQDKVTGAHMDKDPEDVNYNFVRWLNNDVGTAIGPTRVHPLTGEILDADIVLTDGWIRHYEEQFTELLPKVAMEGFGAETLAWLARNPQWDPRVRLAAPEQRTRVAATIAHQFAQRTNQTKAREDLSSIRSGEQPPLCNAADGMAFEVAMMRMHLDLLFQDKDDKDKKDDKKDSAKTEKKEEEQKLDGMPESFVGPLVSHLVAHEVGHTLGLRHNFKASSVYSLADINSDEIKGKEQLAGSVMDYIGVNVNFESGKLQGDWAMTGVGPYDMWAIEYGYSFARDLKPILKRVAEPALVYATDEDTGGPDPLARRYDFGRDPLNYAQTQMRLAKHHRERLVSEYVKDGQSWARTRQGYEMTLGLHTKALNMMSGWIGGAFINRDRKGDPNGRRPVEVVPAEQQRSALKFIIKHAFSDDAFGLNPDLLSRMTVDHWDSGEATWPIHDRIMGVQSSALTMTMNPTTLQRVYDNEFLVPNDQDALTLPELLTDLTSAIWQELEQAPAEKATSRKPAISSLRRNLQREHMERLIDLIMPDAGFTVAYKPISNLARVELQRIHKKIEKSQASAADRHDPYTAAHLAEAAEQIKKALDAEYVYNSDSSSSSLPFFFFRNEGKDQQGRED